MFQKLISSMLKEVMWKSNIYFPCLVNFFSEPRKLWKDEKFSCWIFDWERNFFISFYFIPPTSHGSSNIKRILFVFEMRSWSFWNCFKHLCGKPFNCSWHRWKSVPAFYFFGRRRGKNFPDGIARRWIQLTFLSDIFNSKLLFFKALCLVNMKFFCVCTFIWII